MHTAKQHPLMTDKMSDDLDDPIRFLETHRNTLVTFINADFFIDKLRSNHAFSIDDDQDIQSAHGKRNKARKFVNEFVFFGGGTNFVSCEIANIVKKVYLIGVSGELGLRSLRCFEIPVEFHER